MKTNKVGKHLSYNTAGAARVTGFTRNLIYMQIEAGKLKATKVTPRRIVILAEDLEKWLRGIGATDAK